MLNRLIAMMAVLLIPASAAYAGFEVNPEYRSIIDTDPATRARFSYLFQEHQARVDEVTEGVYLARGYGQGSAIMVEGEDAVLIFDVGDSYENGLRMLQAFREHTDKPIRAIVYSHFHFDHIFGGKAWKDAAASDAQLISHESTLRFLNERISGLAPRTDWGLAMQFGLYLDETCTVGEGPLCSAVMGIQFPRIGSTKGHRRHVIYPDTTFQDRMQVDLGGVTVELIHSPSETPDNVLVWIPERKTILTGDALTPTLAPIFTARGQRVRDPQTWMESVDLMRSLDPDHVVPSHGPAFSGAQADQVLMNYRDAIAFMYHQTVRMINQGKGPEAIASDLRLPEHLASSPVLGQWYNDFQTNIRGIYGYLVGHYNDVAEMPLLDPQVEDRNMLALAGGAEAYLERLQEAHARGDHVWVARAASHLIRVQAENQTVKDLKASSLRVLAAQTISGSQRHFYLQHAAALEGLIDIPVVARFSAEDVATLPVQSLIEQIPFRLDAARAARATDALTIAVSDRNELYRIELRKGVAEVKRIEAGDDGDIVLTSESMRLFYIGELSLGQGFADGLIRGNQRIAENFFAFFEWP